MQVIFDGKRKNMQFNGSVQKLLKELEINDQIVIVKRNRKIVTELDVVSDNDKVEITQVVFGG